MAHVRVGGSASEDGQQCTLVVYLVLVESLGLAWHRVASQSRCFARQPRSNVHSCSQHHQRRRRHRRLTVDEQLILCQHHDRHHPLSPTASSEAAYSTLPYIHCPSLHMWLP